jgi:hypothetical protein
VDFPAPFSPIKACTEPAFTLRETLSNASTPGNLFVMLCISSKLVVLDSDMSEPPLKPFKKYETLHKDASHTLLEG